MFARLMQPTTEVLDLPAGMTAAAVRLIFDRLEESGITARFVGGCVRDLVQGREIGDLDIAVDAAPERVMSALGELAVKIIPTGIDHGTLTVVSAGHVMELTSLRRDVATDGRWAEVSYTDDWLEDAARRDFTMNALYIDQQGRLYDPVAGLSDARAGRVRFVGDPTMRIAEDRLRILRYFRVLARFGVGDPDPVALAACRDAAGQIPNLSAERIQHEMIKLLAAPVAVPCLRLMAEQEILSFILPEAANFARLGRLIEIERLIGADPDPLLRIIALIDQSTEKINQSTEKVTDIAARWRLSVASTRRLKDLAAPGNDFAPDLAAPDLRRLVYGLGPENFRYHALLCWANDKQYTDAQWQALLQQAADWTVPVFPVRGADLLALGKEAGPELGQTMKALEEWWIAADFTPDRDAVLAQLLGGGAGNP